MASDFHQDLAERGLVHQMTSPDLPALLRSERFVAYIGFDPTAPSLHVGSLLPALALARLQRAGHRPIAILGGGTGLIGDPSGKASERAMLTREQLAANLAGIRAQLERFVDFSGPDGALMLDNADWLCRLTLIDFLRDIGKHFSVNQMVQRDAVQLRLQGREQGISFTEFSYGLLQAYDFLELYDRYGCRLQLGGSDQWGNIVDGTDLIRRLRGGTAYGLTMPLVTKADGSKFGKSEAGNVWLDPKLTRPFQMYQFWLNADDRDVGRFLRYFTFLPIEEIRALEAESQAHPERRTAQRALAAAVTELVHGKEAVESARRATEVLFSGGDLRALSPEEVEDAFAGAPRSELPGSELAGEGIDIVTLLARSGLSGSKGQARQSVTEGAIALNNEPVRDVGRRVTRADLLAGKFLVLRRGKKTWHVVVVRD
ncbi:MAG TPA: tyrosine--tRNA ligase [Planctomycetota bacterium]|nr:tyrosine--tRNA ligase [Planctomycetota bacterium]